MFRRLLNLIPHRTIEREPGVPYLTRYYLFGGPHYDSKFPFNLYLHCFHVSDNPIPHNHPWKKAWSLILHGEYREFRPDSPKQYNSVRLFKPGMVNKLRADDFHWVELVTDEVWTLFFTYKRIRKDWGFQTDQGFIDHETYRGKS